MVNQMTFSLYGVTFIASFIISFAYVAGGLRRREVPANIIGYSLLLNTVCILVGAKLFSVITGGFRVTLLQAGVSSLGGAIGLLTGIWLFNKLYGEHTKIFSALYATAMPLLYSVSKLGCFQAGCCRGIPYTGFGSITYDNFLYKTQPLFPVQLLESVIFAGIFAAAVFYYRKRGEEGCVEFCMLLCAVGKFSPDFLREEHLGKVLSVNQSVCIAFFLWAVYRLWSIRCKSVIIDEKTV